jgi:hypothetical protein
MNKVYMGDVGTVINIDCQEDISSSTLSQILVKTPRGDKKIWVATVTDLTTLTYTVVAGDLQEVGLYHLQPFVTLPGWTGKGHTVELEVFAAFR